MEMSRKEITMRKRQTLILSLLLVVFLLGGCAEKEVADIAEKETTKEAVEEAVENTPARILETHHHGAGGYYRQCFYNRELDYKKYDEMFYHTVAEDTEETAVELALNRLRFPEKL